ncbi:hypothetical protein BKP54_30635 [Ensifer sp. 1H6]|nr:hypothetical protein BKP54_30635 [Ensifer sp. 1H6]
MEDLASARRQSCSPSGSRSVRTTGPLLLNQTHQICSTQPSRMIFCERDKEKDILASGCMQNSMGLQGKRVPAMMTRDPGL